MREELKVELTFVYLLLREGVIYHRVQTYVTPKKSNRGPTYI